MAVYTHLSETQIGEFLAAYDCGSLLDFEGIVQGVENTNYRIRTDKDKFILTIFEHRTDPNSLPFFFDFMAHLHKKGIDCPFVIKDRDGQGIKSVAGKSAALFSFLDGNNIAPDDITPEKCSGMGRLLACLHISAIDFTGSRENSMSLPAWKNLLAKIKSVIPAQAGISLSPQDEGDFRLRGSDELMDLMASEIALAETTLALNLPKAVVHADAFPDNIFERDGRIEGVIDFYFSCRDFLLYDFAITFNAWCFKDGEYQKDRCNKFIKGYESLRPLTSVEKTHFSDMARAAALRILMTRQHDWIFHDPENLVKPKDPLEYKRILEFHRDNQILG